MTSATGSTAAAAEGATQHPADATAAAGSKPSRWRDTAVAIGGMLLGIGVIAGAQAIHVGVRTEGLGPRSWPTGLGVVIVLLSALLLLPHQASVEADPAASRGWLKVAGVCAAFVGYGVLWQWIDFRVCTVFLLAALTAIGGGRGIRALVLFPIGLTLLLWLIFGLGLAVPL